MDDPRPPRDPAPDRVGPTLIRNVDLCRGLFAYLVVAAHSYDACWTVHLDALRSTAPGARAVLHATVQAGFYWVMGFFVISGYCIQLSANRMLDAGRFPIRYYLQARLTRIMPLYYLGLLFALAVECLVAPIRPSYYPDGVDAVGFGSQLVFLQRLTRTFGAFAPSWTITNELAYYLAFGLLAAVAARSRSTPAWLGLGISAVVGGSLIALHLLGHRAGWILPVGLLAALGTVWFLGALVAVYGPALVRSPAVRLLARAWPFGLAVAVALRGWTSTPELVIDLELGATFALLLLRFLAADRAEQAHPSAMPTPSRLDAVARFVGLASYPTYLFHGPILLGEAALIRHFGLIADWRVTWCVLVVSGVGVGSALGWWLERPVMRWRAGLLARWKPALDAAAGARAAGRRSPGVTPTPTTLTQGA